MTLLRSTKRVIRSLPMLWRLVHTHIYSRVILEIITPRLMSVLLNLICTRKTALRYLSYHRPWPPSGMIFLNGVGRFLFAARESLLLLLAPTRTRRPILLEGYDDVSFPSLREKGTDTILWPTPLGVDLRGQNRHIDDQLLLRLERSYWLSYEHDTRRFQSSKWWEENCANFREACFDDAGRLRRDTVENFRNVNMAEALIIQDQRILFGSYRKAYLAALRVVIYYHRVSELTDHAILRSASEPFIGGSRYPIYRGQRLSTRLIRHAYYLSRIVHQTRLSPTAPLNILDLGGAYGGQGRLLLNYYRASKLMLVELPEVSVFAGYYLSVIFPNKRVALLADLDIDRLKSDGPPIEDFDIFVLPTWAIEHLPDNSIDLTINTTSLGEMSPDYGNFYVDQVERVTRGYFFSNNHGHSDVARFDEFGFYRWQMKKAWQTINYCSGPTGAIEYLGLKVEEAGHHE